MTLKQPLSHIEKVDLRDVWAHEAHDFTQWLTEEENLSTLGDVIGIDLELIESESSVGSFSADIFAAECGSSRKVIIENQLEDTNHDHLGKIITYAAGKGAELVVWIVARARDEHKQAIEWLNEHTDSEFGFFLIEIEVLKIGDSPAAPRFNVVERPNDWAKAIKQSEGLSDTKKTYLEYWNHYKEQASGNSEFMKYFKPQKPQPQMWTTVHVGSSKYHISLTASIQNKSICVELYIPDDKEIGQSDLYRFFGHGSVRFSTQQLAKLPCEKKGCRKWQNQIVIQMNTDEKQPITSSQQVVPLRKSVKSWGSTRKPDRDG